MFVVDSCLFFWIDTIEREEENSLNSNACRKICTWCVRGVCCERREIDSLLKNLNYDTVNQSHLTFDILDIFNSNTHKKHRFYRSGTYRSIELAVCCWFSQFSKKNPKAVNIKISFSFFSWMAKSTNASSLGLLRQQKSHQHKFELVKLFHIVLAITPILLLLLPSLPLLLVIKFYF